MGIEYLNKDLWGSRKFRKWGGISPWKPHADPPKRQRWKWGGGQSLEIPWGDWSPRCQLRWGRFNGCKIANGWAIHGNNLRGPRKFAGQSLEITWGPGITRCEWKEIKQGDMGKWCRIENQKLVGQSLKTVRENGPTRCQWLELSKMKDASQQEDR